MNMVVAKDSITVAYDSEFILALMLFTPSLLGIVLYHIYAGNFLPPSFFTGVLVFFFVALISGLVAHTKTFLSGSDIFLWKVDHSGFYFQASRTNLFSLKKPTAYAWKKTTKVLYIKEFTTLDSDLDKMVYKDVILVFGHLPKNRYKMLSYPGEIGFELFEVMRGLAPYDNIFESVDNYSDL